MKEAVSREKDAHMAMCQNYAEENTRRYGSMKNKAKKAVKEKAVEAQTELRNCQNLMF